MPTRRGVLAVLALTTLLIGCAVDPPLPTSASIPPATATPSAGHVAGTPRLPIPDVPMTPCPGTDWPPAGTNARDAITANWYDSIAPGGLWVQVTNRTSEAYVIVVSGSAPSEADACRTTSSSGGSGPMHAGSTFEMSVVDAGRQVGIYVFAKGCGEGCDQGPVGWMALPRSPTAPVATD